jgi:tetratricopeptide (TPR) repeat protein
LTLQIFENQPARMGPKESLMSFARAALLLLVLGSAVALQAQKSKDTGTLSVSLPGKSWALQVDVQGFRVKVDETKPDGRKYLIAENDVTGVTLSITMAQVGGSATLDDCWKVLRGRNKANAELNPVDIKESQIGDMAISEFILVEPGGIPLHQKNVFGCLAREDVYADIHLSKVEYTPKDQALFISILQAVHVKDRIAEAGAQANSTSYWTEGSKYFREGQFDKAIGPYRKALDLEKADRKLDASFWRVLIDNLGMAYGITGDLKSAEEVFRYGISKDPTYPIFYYNMACTYAERNDLDNTIKYLKTAFQYKRNTIPGERMPDPSKDDSFQRFMQNETFRKLIKSL